MNAKKQKYDKLVFQVDKIDGVNEGTFDWGKNRSKIFKKFYDTNDMEDPETEINALHEIIDEDPQFIDAYNSLGFWENSIHNYGNAFTFFITAYEIGTKVIPKNYRGTIKWGYLDNRPFLRAMHSLGLTYAAMRAYEKADKIYMKILSYNKSDNQGIRALAIENKLIIGDFTGILKICKTYDDDTMPDTLFGKIIAHYRLGEKEKALSALHIARETSPNVVKELLKKKHTEIISEFQGGVVVGGEDEAYDYWERNRVIWTDPELINFIKNNR